jgi:subtilisin-like proprotein convertase family protein
MISVGHRTQGPPRLRRIALAGVMALALIAAIGMTLGSSAQAKKKHKKSPSVFQAQLSPNAAIPDGPASGPATPLKSTITVGKKFKGKVVGDLNVTGIQTTGSVSNAARDLRMKLIAPNGRTIYLIGRNLGDVSIGPLTIDADSRVAICDSNTGTSCSGGTFSGDPSATLIRPFAGTANSQGLGAMSSGGVRSMNGVPMKGTWTFEVFDQAPGKTSTLNSWGLQITAAKPIT